MGHYLPKDGLPVHIVRPPVPLTESMIGQLGELITAMDRASDMEKTRTISVIQGLGYNTGRRMETPATSNLVLPEGWDE